MTAQTVKDMARDLGADRRGIAPVSRFDQTAKGEPIYVCNQCRAVCPGSRGDRRVANV